jgi:hypothetical protein
MKSLFGHRLMHKWCLNGSIAERMI